MSVLNSDLLVCLALHWSRNR